MGSGPSSQYSDFQINAQFALVKAHYQKRMGLSHQVNELKMTRQYYANNSDFKDQKQIEVIKKSTVTTLIDTKVKLQSFFQSDLAQNIRTLNCSEDFLTEFVHNTRFLENFLSEEIFSYYEKIPELRTKLESLKLRKKHLKFKFQENQDFLRQTLIAKRKIVHKKTLLSEDASISTNISNLSYNFSEGGALTERSLHKTMDRLKCIPKLRNYQMYLMSKISLKKEMTSSFLLAKASIDKKIEKARETIKILEENLGQNHRKYSEIELDLLLSRYL